VRPGRASRHLQRDGQGVEPIRTGSLLRNRLLIDVVRRRLRQQHCKEHEPKGPAAARAHTRPSLRHAAGGAGAGARDGRRAARARRRGRAPCPSGGRPGVRSHAGAPKPRARVSGAGHALRHPGRRAAAAALASGIPVAPSSHERILGVS